MHCVEIKLRIESFVSMFWPQKSLWAKAYSPYIPHVFPMYSPVEPLHLPCQDDGADSDSEAGSMEPIVTHSDHESDSFPQHEMSKDLELEVQSATKETDGHRTCHKTCHKAQ